LLGGRETGRDERFGGVDRRGNEHEPLHAPIPVGEQPARQQQGKPATHRGADDDLAAFGESKDRLGLFEPAADGAIFKSAARSAVTGIIEAGNPKSVFGAKLVDSARFGPRHNRSETIEPKKSGVPTLSPQHGNITSGDTLADAKFLLYKGTHRHSVAFASQMGRLSGSTGLN